MQTLDERHSDDIGEIVNVMPETTFFRDGKREIDFVLAIDSHFTEFKDFQATFEKHLIEEGKNFL